MQKSSNINVSCLKYTFGILNTFQPSDAFHRETSHLIRRAKQVTGFYMKCNAWLNCVNVWFEARKMFNTCSLKDTLLVINTIIFFSICTEKYCTRYKFRPRLRGQCNDREQYSQYRSIKQFLLYLLLGYGKNLPKRN